MKLKTGILIIGLILNGSIMAGGGGSSSKPLDGSYPIVLSHGILGFDDTNGLANGLVKYWGGMDDYLRSEGADVLTPGKTTAGASNVRASQEKNLILYWMAANGFSKVNIIAHSQGAQDTRYMISNLGMSSKVKVLTTVNGVHKGAPLADVVNSLVPGWLEPFFDTVVDFIGDFVYGDSDQDVMASLYYLSVANADAVNAASPNVYGQKYFSYGSKMTWADPVQHPLMFLMYPITWVGGLVNGLGSANDGVVPYNSQVHGTWKGGPSYNFWISGVDHVQAVNFEYTGQFWFDVEEYYLKMATNAMNSQ